MAKINKKGSSKTPKVDQVTENKMFGMLNWQLLSVAMILIATYLCFLPSLSSKKEFTNWDDPMYVTEQPLITSLSKENIKLLFKPETHVALNYHPITMLSLALNYSNSKLNPKSYVQTNILFHILNTLLVFIFLYLLSGKKFWVGAIAGLWFGIHPMHVESVAWVSERKDVLYCFFFLLACISYLQFLDTKRWSYLFLVFVLFVLSCLSKAMAVPLPFILLLIDYYMQRKIDIRVILEKIPFLLVAIWIGYTATKIQSTKAIADFEIFTTAQRIMFVAYGFMMYWVKLILPINLSSYYPYPSTDANGGIPLIYNLAPFIVIAAIALPVAFLLKKGVSKSINSQSFRVFVFSLMFFILMIALVLQFVSVGTVIMADRYSYLPYIGALFLIAVPINNLIENEKLKTVTFIGVTVFSVFLAYLTFNRVKIWTNSETLWTNVINQYPYKINQTGNLVNVEQVGVEVAHKNRGNYYREHGMLDKAFDDYNILARAGTKSSLNYSNLGNLYAMQKNFDKSLEMYSKAILLDSGLFDNYLNRGITFSLIGKNEEALSDFSKAYKLNPANLNLLVSIASENLNLKRHEECIKVCNSIMMKDVNNALAYFYRGTSYVNIGKTDEAIKDIKRALSLDENNGNAWFNLSFAYNQSGNYKAALEAAQMAKAKNYPVNEAYLNGLIQKSR